jgi:hypothetical protein
MQGGKSLGVATARYWRAILTAIICPSSFFYLGTILTSTPSQPETEHLDLL